ncbi:MAG: hypothetical protein KGL39_40240 [Patescibacteria group bacterium]|nr:hypothetical protein [Patescibacteria group bacterium]
MKRLLLIALLLCSLVGCGKTETKTQWKVGDVLWVRGKKRVIVQIRQPVTAGEVISTMGQGLIIETVPADSPEGRKALGLPDKKETRPNPISKALPTKPAKAKHRSMTYRLPASQLPTRLGNSHVLYAKPLWLGVHKKPTTKRIIIEWKRRPARCPRKR